MVLTSELTRRASVPTTQPLAAAALLPCSTVTSVREPAMGMKTRTPDWGSRTLQGAHGPSVFGRICCTLFSEPRGEPIFSAAAYFPGGSLASLLSLPAPFTPMRARARARGCHFAALYTSTLSRPRRVVRPP